MQRWLTGLGLIVCCVAAGAGETNGSSGRGSHLEADLLRFLRAQAAAVRCDEAHFIYGVGSLDGSYVERIFYVAGEGDAPVVSARLRGPLTELPAGESGADMAPVPFVLEMHVPRALQARPHGAGWADTGDGWQSALRFKYTVWFGEVGRVDGRWRIDWAGYRRPLLPTATRGDATSLCAVFAGR